MKYKKSRLYIFLLLGMSLATLYGQQTKERQREIKKYWRNELKAAKSVNHKKIAERYPETGWLSGLWCKEGESDPYIHIQVEGNENINVVTRGYTATAQKVIFIPETFLYVEGEYMGAPVAIENDTFYDLWYFPVGTGASTWRWFYVERIRRISDVSYEVVYRNSYTIKDPSIDFVKFFKKKSPNIPLSKHYKTPKVYVKCK